MIGKKSLSPSCITYFPQINLTIQGFIYQNVHLGVNSLLTKRRVSQKANIFYFFYHLISGLWLSLCGLICPVIQHSRLEENMLQSSPICPFKVPLKYCFCFYEHMLLLLSHFSHVRLCVTPNSLGKNTGVGCHFLLQCVKVKSENEVAQSCPTLRDPMDRSLPGSSTHGIFQARVLEWGAIA